MTDAAKIVGLPPKAAPDPRRERRTFGLGFAGILGAFGALAWWRGSPNLAQGLAAGAGLSFVLALAWPTGLKPAIWAMTWIGHGLGWVNTRLLLGIAYYVLFAPIALLRRVFRIDPLDRRIDRAAASYWHRRDPADSEPERCERPF
ncbi:MAG: hypothetical protein KC466_18060 [Myxococcales bacterium]|nr:hypothetical protein [Myxococcales bacterium]